MLLFNIIKKISKKVLCNVLIIEAALCLIFIVFPTQAYLLHAETLQFPSVKVNLAEKNAVGNKISVAGAKNEYLILTFKVNGGDPSFFKTQVTGTGSESQIKINFYQVVSAPVRSPDAFQPDALFSLEQGPLKVAPVSDVWAIIKISPSTPRGVHNFELVLSDNKASFRQPLEIKVWNFALPQDLPIPILANTFVSKNIYDRYGGNSHAQFDLKVKAILRSMREYKINSIGTFYPFPAKQFLNNKKVEDFPGFEHLLRYVVNDLNYRFFRVPTLGGAKEIGNPGNDWASQAKIFYPAFADYLRRHQLENRAIIKVIDEPKPQYYGKVIQAYSLIKSLVPNIKTESAGRAPVPDFAKIINIWVSYAQSYDPQAINQARSMGQEVWLYANKMHGIDQPLINQRIIGWYVYRYKFQGYLLWGVDKWEVDPWTQGARVRGTSLRRGTFYYPNPETGMPIPTTRLEALRRGWQDYQYLDLLAKAAQTGRVQPAEYQQIRQRVNAATEGLNNQTPRVSWAELEDLRLRIGELLDRAAGR